MFGGPGRPRRQPGVPRQPGNAGRQPDVPQQTGNAGRQPDVLSFPDEVRRSLENPASGSNAGVPNQRPVVPRPEFLVPPVPSRKRSYPEDTGTSTPTFPTGSGDGSSQPRFLRPSFMNNFFKRFHHNDVSASFKPSTGDVPPQSSFAPDRIIVDGRPSGSNVQDPQRQFNLSDASGSGAVIPDMFSSVRFPVERDSSIQQSQGSGLFNFPDSVNPRRQVSPFFPNIQTRDVSSALPSVHQVDSTGIGEGLFSASYQNDNNMQGMQPPSYGEMPRSVIPDAFSQRSLNLDSLQSPHFFSGRDLAGPANSNVLSVPGSQAYVGTYPARPPLDPFASRQFYGRYNNIGMQDSLMNFRPAVTAMPTSMLFGMNPQFDDVRYPQLGPSSAPFPGGFVRFVPSRVSPFPFGRNDSGGIGLDVSLQPSSFLHRNISHTPFSGFSPSVSHERSDFPVVKREADVSGLVLPSGSGSFPLERSGDIIRQRHSENRSSEDEEFDRRNEQFKKLYLVDNFYGLFQRLAESYKPLNVVFPSHENLMSGDIDALRVLRNKLLAQFSTDIQRKQIIWNNFKWLIPAFYRAQYYHASVKLARGDQHLVQRLQKDIDLANQQKKELKFARLKGVLEYRAKLYAEIEATNHTLYTTVDECNRILAPYVADPLPVHFLPDDFSNYYMAIKLQLSALLEKWKSQKISWTTDQFAQFNNDKKLLDEKLSHCQSLKWRLDDKKRIYSSQLVKSFTQHQADQERNEVLNELRTVLPDSTDTQLTDALVERLIDMYEDRIKNIDTTVIEHFNASIMDEMNNKDLKKKKKADNENQNDNMNVRKYNLQKRLEYCDEISSNLMIIRSNTDKDTVRNTVIRTIIALHELYKLIYIKDPDEISRSNSLSAIKMDFFQELRTMNMQQIAFLARMLYHRVGDHTSEVSLSGHPPLPTSPLQGPESLFSVEMASVTLPAHTPPRANILRHNSFSMIMTPIEGLGASDFFSGIVVGTGDKPPTQDSMQRLFEEDVVKPDIDKPDIDVLPDESICAQAYKKMSDAWSYWQKTSDTRLENLNSVYGFDQGLRRNRLKYSDTGLMTFFLRVILHDKFLYKESEHGPDIEFTYNDFINAMDPRFPAHGHQILQKDWRVKAGSGWWTGKNFKPLDNVPDGEKKRKGLHEWIPTADLTGLLYMALKYFAKKDIVAFLALADFLRTDTSDVPLGFKLHDDLDIDDVNANPGNYKVSQLGVWKHHSGGAYSPEKQLNTGNPELHRELGQAMNSHITPTKVDLPKAIDALEDVARRQLYGGEISAFHGISPAVMKHIGNDLTRNSQKNPARPAPRYGHFAQTSTMKEVNTSDGKEFIGSVIFEEASNLEELLVALAETKQLVLTTFRNRKLAFQRFYDLNFDHYLSGNKFDLGTDDLASDALLAQLGGDYDNALKLWHTVYTNVSERWKDAPQFIAPSAYMLGCLHRQSGNYDEAKKFLEECQSINQQHRRLAIATIETDLELAGFYREFAQPEHAIKMAKEANDIYKKLPLQQREDRAGLEALFKTTRLLTSLYHETGDIESATSYLAENIQVLKTEVMQSHANIAEFRLSHHLLAMMVQDRNGQYSDDFEDQVRESLSLCNGIENQVEQANYVGAFEFQHGKYLLEKKLVKQAQQAMEHAFSAYQQYPQKYWREMAQVAFALGDLCIQQAESRSAEAVIYYRQADQLYREYVGHVGHPFHLRVLQTLFSCYEEYGMQQEGQELLDQIADVDLNREVVSAQLADHLVWVSERSRAPKGSNEEEMLLRNAFLISSRTSGKESVATRSICLRLAQLYADRNDHPKVLQWVNRLCDYEKRAHQQFLTLPTMEFAADMYTRIGRYNDAEELYKQILQKPMRLTRQAKVLYVVQLGNTPRGDIYKAKLAHLYLQQNRIKDAQDLLEPIIQSYTGKNKIYDDGTSSIYGKSLVYRYAAQACQKEGPEKYDQAERWYQESLRILGNDGVDKVDIYRDLGELYQVQGRSEAARAAFDRATEISLTESDEDKLLVTQSEKDPQPVPGSSKGQNTNSLKFLLRNHYNPTPSDE